MNAFETVPVGNDTDSGMGQRIKEARETLGWSQDELAHRMGVTLETITGWESDDRDPRSNRIITLAGVLGVSAHWLLDGSAEFAPDDSNNHAAAARAQLQSVRMKINELTQLVADIEAQLDQL
ncbi:MAG: helix-turn-helix transcriptional regulator [Alphaproteobacteria bacterium]|nr:helix-turn-helix transcriptional regulator [Alphaproteobacteria bacterium]